MDNKKLKTVGITPRWDGGANLMGISYTYIDSILKAGAAPMLLPLTDSAPVLEAAAAKCDGFLFIGGPDIDPAYFGEEKRFDSVEVSPERDRMEAALFKLVLETRKPVLGICRGIQVINVMLGGTLYQDIPSEYSTDIRHSMDPPADRIWHKVTLTEGEPLKKLIGREEIGVNSSHHQAIRELAPGLKVMAVSEDGLTEAVYMPDHPFLWGVQWHPERLWQTGPESEMLFRAFIGAMEQER